MRVMATFDLPKEVNTTAYLTFSGNKSAGSGFVFTKATDGESDSVFNVNDKVTLTWVDSNGREREFDATFVGTISVTVSGQVKVFMVFDGGGTIHYVIGLKPSDAPEKIVLTGPSADVVAESFTVCFFPGTLIATPSGERKVEELVSGDPVSIGDMRTVPVKWIGRQTVSTLFGPADRLMPVRFAAGSLGGGATPSAA